MAESQVPDGLKLLNSLALESCPHCGRAHPYIGMPNQQGNWIRSTAHDGQVRMWGIYACSSRGKLVVATGPGGPGSEVTEVYPVPRSVAEELPDEPKRFLAEAITCLHAPSAAIMLCASAVDAMLKEKGYDHGKLYERIEKAVKDHLLTEDMGNHVRLEANEQRHADKNAKPPTREDAEQSIEFTEALGEILFVLPSRVKRGIIRAEVSATSTSSATVTPRLIPS